MFENRQDTTLLRDSLISSANYLKAKKESMENYDPEEEQKNVDIVVSTICSLTCNLYEVNTVVELFEKRLLCNRRCHAVVFINLLRSQGIVSSESGSFYQSVLHNLPSVDWSFYLKLNFSCYWSEPFIECAQQLEPDTLAVVLRKLLEVQCHGELKYYTWHLVLQTVIWKTFILQSPSLSESEKYCLFHFKFSVPESLVESGNEIEEFIMKNSSLGHLPQVYDIIMKSIYQEAEQEMYDINFVKVVLHAFKTLFKLSISISDCEGPKMDSLLKLNLIIAKCLMQESSKAVIVKRLIESNQCAIDSGCLTVSWEVSECFLIFILQNFWRDFIEKYSGSSKLTSSPPNISEYRREFRAFMNEKGLSYKYICDLNEECLNTCEDAKKRYYLLLKNVIIYNYPYASRAAEYFLLHSDLWEPYNILDLLEEKISNLDPFDIHKSLADAVVKAGTQNTNRFVMLFLTVLSRAPSEIYNDVIMNILENWGYCNYFKSSNFESQLTQFTRKTITLKEAEQPLLSLFVQSPNITLKSLIEQAVMQGSDGMEMMQILKIVPIVCLYETKEEPVPPLIALLLQYFEDDLTEHEVKNFVLLVNTVMEMETTEDILSFDLFLEKCIFPYSTLHNIHKLEFTLECLNVSLDVLISKHALEISSENFIELVKTLGEIMSFCIENAFAKLKETVIGILELLAKHKKKPHLDLLLKVGSKKLDESQSADQNDVVSLYILGIFMKELNPEQYKEIALIKWKNKVIEEKCELLWIWCCVTNNSGLFADKITRFDLSYENLLTVLIPLLWHFTKVEWRQSTKLIMYYQHLLECGASDYPWLLPQSDPELYGVIRCLIDSFTIMMQKKSSKENPLVCSCLINTIMDLLSKTTVPSLLLLNVFLDVCHLVSILDTETISIFSSFLMSLRRNFLSICDKKVKNDCIKLLKFGVDNLPDSQDKASLIQKINKV